MSYTLKSSDPDAIYREHIDGRWEYWVYKNRMRVYVASTWAQNEITQGTRCVTVK